MSKEKRRMEYRYYEIPAGEYVLPLLGKGWEQEYGVGYDGLLHFHNHMEIGYCYRGNGTMQIQEEVRPYRGGVFTVIPANIPHVTASAPGHICKWEYLFVDVKTFLAEVTRERMLDRDEVLRVLDGGVLYLTEEEYPDMARLVRKIMDEYRRQDRYYLEAVKGYLYALLMEALRVHTDQARFLQTQTRSDYVEEAVRYISSHFSENIQMADVARSCGLSESHFRRVFEENMNMKPLDFLNLVRIREACRMIEREDYSMRDICFRCGYETPSTFNRNFRRLTGMTPNAWKKEKGNLPDFFREFRITAQKGWEA